MKNPRDFTLGEIETTAKLRGDEYIQAGVRELRRYVEAVQESNRAYQVQQVTAQIAEKEPARRPRRVHYPEQSKRDYQRLENEFASCVLVSE